MLITDWKTIGTAGDTIDGREITEQDLIDAAETYDQEEYTAVINSDHLLWLYGNFGHVDQVRLGTDKKGRTTLQAKLAPNSRLIEKNKNGQGVFTSMELWPNFANSGKTYLSGLAVTDEPASLGTSMLKFSKESGNKPDRIYSKASEEKLTLDDHEEDKDSVLKNLAASLAEVFKLHKSNQENTQPPANDPSEDDMSKEALEKLQQQGASLESAVTKLADSISKKFNKEEQEEETPAGNEGGEETSAVTSEQFSQLEKQNEKLQGAVDHLTETFNKLLEEKPGTKPKPNSGDNSQIDFV